MTFTAYTLLGYCPICKRIYSPKRRYCNNCKDKTNKPKLLKHKWFARKDIIWTKAEIEKLGQMQ